MKKFIKINLIILVIFCLNINFLLFPTNATENDEEQEYYENEAYEEVEKEKEEKDKTLDDLQIEKSELENQINSSNEQIQFIENELSVTVAEIAEINQKILDKQMEIETLEAQEEDLLKYLQKAERELEKSNKRFKDQKELLDKRLIALYEIGTASYLDILLSSKNISEFLSNYYLITEITEADTTLLKNVEAEKIYNEKLNETLNIKKQALDESKEKKEQNAILLENMSIIRTNKLQSLTEEEMTLEQEIEEYQKQVAEIETEIRLLAIANVGAEYVGGSMAWPVPGYTRITSPFGMRTHPITGVYKLHTGCDIGAPYGAQFIAANDGVVTYAGENRAYGKMVIIDHGGGVTTLYAHGSNIEVNVGDTVFQGTPVLAVGSTGYSTGPHAHFEVRINGEYVQPLDYITSYSSETKENKVEDTKKNEITETTENSSQTETVELN